MFRNIRNIFIVLLLGISIIFASNASAEEINVNDIDPEVNRVNTQLLEIDNKLQEIFGDEATISSLGYMIVDEDGVIQISLKNDRKKLARTINSSEEKLAEMISWLEQQEIIISKDAQYSAEELTDLSDLIVKDINNYYNYQFPTDFTLAVEPDVEKQIIKVKYDFSHEAALDNDLLNDLQSKYNIISFEDTNYTNVTFTKNKKSDWNKLGGGLAVSSSSGGPECTTTALLHKNSNYFLLTAGHCFEGSVSSTGGAYQYQYNKVVGRQHSTGLWNNIDAGLIRFEGNTLSGGRYATNGVKMVSDSTTTESFNNRELR